MFSFPFIRCCSLQLLVPFQNTFKGKALSFCSRFIGRSSNKKEAVGFPHCSIAHLHNLPPRRPEAGSAPDPGLPYTYSLVFPFTRNYLGAPLWMKTQAGVLHKRVPAQLLSSKLLLWANPCTSMRCCTSWRRSPSVNTSSKYSFRPGLFRRHTLTTSKLRLIYFYSNFQKKFNFLSLKGRKTNPQSRWKQSRFLLH